MLTLREKWFYLLLVFIPISLFCEFFTQNSTITFITVVISIIPLAYLIGFATKELTLQTSPMVGGLINATFGNVIELIIAFSALRHGLIEIVKASIIGSIIGNLLLLIGLSVLFGGLKYKEQKFNKVSVGISSTMLIIAVVGLAVPTIFSITVKGSAVQEVLISDAVAVVLALIYIAGLLFAFITHKHHYDVSDELRWVKEKSTINPKRAALILLLATLAVAFQSELLVRDVQQAAINIGLTETFIGVVIIAVLANVAEKTNAVYFAMKNKLDVSLEIGLSSAIQIALFVVPTLMLISHIFNFGFSLVFSLFEIVAMFFAVMIINYLSADGKCNWLEGAQLISVYLILAIAFFFV